MPVDFNDALGVRLHQRTGERAARLRLDFGRELLVLDLLVPLEGDAIDDRILDHGDYDSAARTADLHVLEQAGFNQGFQAIVDRRIVQPSAGSRLEIGAYGLDLDTPVPDD